MKQILENKWILIVIVIVIVLTIGSWLLFYAAPNETVQVEVELDESLIEIENTIDATQKANEFILNRIPNDDVFLKFHFENGQEESYSKEQYEIAALEMFYGAVNEENITYLTSALTPESFQELWGNEMDFEEREQRIIEYLNELNHNGSLNSMEYKMELDKFDHPTDNGTIIFSYTDNSTREIEFSFETTGKGHEQLTQIKLANINKTNTTE